MAVKIPSQVTEAAELAEKLHEKMFSTQPIKETEEEDNEGVVPEPEDSQNEDVNDVPHDDNVEDLRKFKSRYLSLKGKYDAEVPRLQHELRDLKQSVVEKLAAISENPVTKQASSEPAPDDIITRLRDEYGEDFIDGIIALNEQIADKKIKSSIATVQEKVTSVEETQLKVAQEEFKKYLDDKTDTAWRPLWEGKDPKFLEFLQQPDPSGLYTYGALVQLYNDSWEADKLATVINTYLGTTATKAKPAKENPSKAAMVAPSRSAVHVAPEASEKTIWTRDAIKEFERADRQGKFTAEESKSMWNDLMLAPSEGRIR